MAHPQVANHCALTVPRKIGSEIGERHRLVVELPKSGVPDDFWPKFSWPEIYRPGDFDQRRRVKFRAGERFPQAQSIKKRLQIQGAAYLEIGVVTFPVPISASDETALAVAPFAMCDVQVLIIPFSGGGQISYFIAAALQSVPVQRRLYVRLFDFCDVSAKF